MEKYLEHLKSDIRESYEKRYENTEHLIHPVHTVLKDVPDKFAHVPFYPMKKVSAWMQLDVEAFPPADKLTEDQLCNLTGMLRNLLWFYHYEAIVPFDLPLDKEYTFLLQALNKDEINNLQEEDEAAPTQIYLCNEDGNDCPFNEYCGYDNEYGCYEGHNPGNLGWGKYNDCID